MSSWGNSNKRSSKSTEGRIGIAANSFSIIVSP
jgi:hypothetical protein